MISVEDKPDFRHTAPIDEGTIKLVRFVRVRTLLHDAHNLILPGGANIVTAVDDVGIFQSLGAGRWRCQIYFRSNMVPLTGSTLYAPLPSTRTITGTSDTLVLADANLGVRTTNGSAVAVTVPPNASVAFPVGTVIPIAQDGVGAVTVTAGSGVTVNVKSTKTLVLDGQYSIAALVKTATNTWRLTGELVAA